jgi:hypothetical protein
MMPHLATNVPGTAAVTAIVAAVTEVAVVPAAVVVHSATSGVASNKPPSFLSL